LSVIALAGMQLVCGGAVLLAGSGLIGEWKEFKLGGVSAVSWAAFAYLTLGGSVIAYTAYVWLLDRVPGSLVTTYTFITPIIAIFLGWTFLGERLSPQMLLGTMLVIGSVILVWRLETESGGRKQLPSMRVAQEGRPGATAAAKGPNGSPVPTNPAGPRNAADLVGITWSRGP
jgi:drug/metabolite transporter (DMT)-like permease